MNKNKISEKDEKILSQFPKYEKGKPFVGTREYWEGVFSWETNRKPELHAAFSELHHKIVNEVVQFCEKYGLDNITEVHISADGLEESFGYKQWMPCTDSSMSLIAIKKDAETGWEVPDRENPFLYEI